MEMITENTMQNRRAHLKPSSPAAFAGASLTGGVRRSLLACFLFAIAFCGGIQGSAAAAQQDDGTTPATNPANPPAEPAPASGSTRPDATYMIGADDVLAINVWKENEITRSVPVRSDGRISLPLIGDVQAAGRTPMQLEQDIAEKLKGYITDPQVTVIVQQINSQKFNILGQVGRPGSFPLTAGTTIVDAIAIAGGFRDFAKKKGVYLLRQGPTGNQERYNFNYERFIKGKDTAQNIKVQPHDTIVVP
jgi:polysaccharide export outer membrane protein